MVRIRPIFLLVVCPDLPHCTLSYKFNSNSYTSWTEPCLMSLTFTERSHLSKIDLKQIDLFGKPSKFFTLISQRCVWVATSLLIHIGQVSRLKRKHSQKRHSLRLSSVSHECQTVGLIAVIWNTICVVSKSWVRINRVKAPSINLSNLP